MDKIIENKGLIRKKHIPYIIAGAVALALIIWSIFGDHRSQLRVDKRGISSAMVERGLFNDFVRVTGQVQPITTIQLTPLEGGVVEQILKEEGAIVKRGDAIIKLTNSQLNLAILESEASLAEKENFLRNTLVQMEQQKLDLAQSRLQLNLDVERKHRRYTQNLRMYQEKLIPGEEYLQSKEDYDLAVKSHTLLIERQKQDSLYRTIQIENMQESLASMRKSMVLIRERVNNLTLKSPIDGQLGSLDVVLGQSVSTGGNIGRISDLSDFKIEAMIDEHYIDRVRPDLEATFERQSNKFSLKVKKVYPDVRNGQFKTDLSFTGERPDNIRTGQTYYINMELGKADNSIIIPKGTFYQKTGGSWIFVLDKSGEKAYKRAIRIGRQNPNYYEVLDGLEPGESIIVSGYESFGNNEILILK
jgi:HlyD family secretion protein